MLFETISFVLVAKDLSFERAIIKDDLFIDGKCEQIHFRYTLNRMRQSHVHQFLVQMLNVEAIQQFLCEIQGLFVGTCCRLIRMKEEKTTKNTFSFLQFGTFSQIGNFTAGRDKLS